MSFDLSLSPETVQEYANAADRNLTAPSGNDVNPTFRAGKEAGHGSWTEVVKIHDTAIQPIKKDPLNENKFCFVFTLAVQGTDAGGFATNAGRTHTEYVYIDKVGLASSDPKVSGSFKRRLAAVNSLLAACGVDLAAGISSYKEWLEGEKPLVGMTVAAVLRKYRNNNNETQVQADGFAAIG